MKKNEVIYTKTTRFVMKNFSIKKKALLALAITWSLLSSDLLIAANLEKVLYSKLPSDKVQINLTTNDGTFPEPKIFSTKDPARVVFDFYGVKSNLKETDFRIGTGAVDTLKVVEVADRTRLVMNLNSPVAYKVSQENGQYIILVDNKVSKVASVHEQKAEYKPFAKRPELPSGKKINKIDFRRTNSAGGRVIVNLSDPQTAVNVGQKDGEVVVDFKDIQLDADLEKRLDVTDFATTVSSIDT
ncbi:MAG: AMIN domain-containing protein, partial [Arenicella sp.]